MIRAKPSVRTLQWGSLALLVISICINFADRGTLGVAAKNISSELHIAPKQLGILLAAFSFTYALSQLLAGKLIDRWNVNWVYAGGFLIWSAATGFTGLAHNFTTVMCLRLLLGFSESVAYPAYSKMIVISYPEQFRGTANALIDAGSKLGPALGILLGIKMMQWFSWRGMFFAIGSVSLLWLLPWCLIAGRLPSRPISTAIFQGPIPNYRNILRLRSFWGTTLGLFGGNYVWFFFLNWLPYYFETERHYTHNRLALFGSLPFWALAASSIFFGLLTDSLIRRGWEAGRVRQSFVCLGLLGCCFLMLPSVLVHNESVANGLLLLACTSMGAWSSNCWAFTQFLAGTRTAGTWTALQNCFGNFAGVAGQIVSGYALQKTHSFFAAFSIACAVLFCGVVGYWVVVGKPSEVKWNDLALRGLSPVPSTS